MDGVADVWGPCGSGCERRKERRTGEQRAADARGQGGSDCWRAEGTQATLGHKLGRARTPSECGCGWAGWAAACWRAEKPSRPRLRGLLLFLFPFFFSFPLFEFKFGLEFEFKTEVTYSLEFKEFCLIITLWFITLMELLNIA